MAMRMAAAAAVALVAVMGVLAPRAAAQTTPNCAAKLVPCSQYINTTGTPPATCCDPLKDAVQNDLKCLCDLYATPEIFKAFNISLDAALGLSKRCGLNDTTAACKGLSPTQSPPGSPSGGGSGSNAGHRTLSVGFPVLMSLFLALWSVLA
ncbi:non-specific lipid transfer protein GPI-anchored 7-like [Miscanthus floridulus]|uniref:non-specific lipid transfer protein GPI-anchored 7-like n=1 Tax=Miscanthus floridulus TaxID=154761 RepID=UPI0034586B41